MQDPQFQMGLGLLGAASPKNRGLLEAYNMLQNQAKRKQEEQKMAQEVEYRRAQTEVARMNADKYGQQAQKEIERRQRHGTWSGE